MGHLTANNGSFPQQRTTQVGGELPDSLIVFCWDKLLTINV